MSAPDHIYGTKPNIGPKTPPYAYDSMSKTFSDNYSTKNDTLNTKYTDSGVKLNSDRFQEIRNLYFTITSFNFDDLDFYFLQLFEKMAYMNGANFEYRLAGTNFVSPN